jgi:hypothetical protein
MARATARALALAGLACAVPVTTLALAADEDRPAAEAALRDVDAAPASLRPVTSELAARARLALARGAKLRAAGDAPHAKMADAAARTWAEAAREALRAVAIEERAAVARLAANDAGTMADRERARLEEGVAQAGRLRAQIETTARDAARRDGRDARDGGTR